MAGGIVRRLRGRHQCQQQRPVVQRGRSVHLVGPRIWLARSLNAAPSQPLQGRFISYGEEVHWLHLNQGASEQRLLRRRQSLTRAQCLHDSLSIVWVYMTAPAKSGGGRLPRAERTYHGSNNRYQRGGQPPVSVSRQTPGCCHVSESRHCADRGSIDGRVGCWIARPAVGRAEPNVDHLHARSIAWHRRQSAGRSWQADHGGSEGARPACNPTADPDQCRRSLSNSRGERRGGQGQDQRDHLRPVRGVIRSDPLTQAKRYASLG